MHFATASEIREGWSNKAGISYPVGTSFANFPSVAFYLTLKATKSLRAPCSSTNQANTHYQLCRRWFLYPALLSPAATARHTS